MNYSEMKSGIGIKENNNIENHHDGLANTSVKNKTQHFPEFRMKISSLSIFNTFETQ